MSIDNEVFEHHLSAYLNYFDSSGYVQSSDYIVVKCSTKGDTIYFSIHRSGGAYSIIYNLNKFVDYFDYKGHDVSDSV